MKFFRFVSILVLALCPGPQLHAVLVDGVVAVINDAVITRQQVEDFAAPALESLRRQYASDPDGFQIKLNDMLTNSLELLIERQLILHDFDAEGYRLPDSAVDDLVQNSIRDRFGDRVTLMKTLQAQGETFEEFRKGVRDQYIETALRQKNVSQEIIVSPYQVENYYNAHPDDFKVEDEVKLRMIVLNKTSADDTNTVNLAREIQTKIKGGTAFAEMASVNSQGAQQHPGGAYDWVERSVLRKELADAAFALQPGQVSDVIDTPGACYLLLVEDKHAARVKLLNEVRDDIEKTLRTQEQARLEKQWIESLKKKTFIRIFP
jgi:parvulin-like peptidyl-prolyl isomerase